MSTENAGSASPQDSSGIPETKDQDKVAYDTYRRVLSEAKKLKEQVKLFEEEKSKGNEQKLKDQNEWKVLADSYKSQLDEKSKTLTDLNDQVVNGMKYQEFEKHLGGRLKNKDYATFIDFEKIVINPETRRVDEESVKGEASRFAKEHSSLVEFSSGRLPNESAKGSTSFSVGKSIESMTAKELEDFIKSQSQAGLIS
jgi:hypothetical protein